MFLNMIPFFFFENKIHAITIEYSYSGETLSLRAVLAESDWDRVILIGKWRSEV